MENVADALKMAGAVLLFVLALSIIIFYFGQVRQVSDTILTYKDRETLYIDGDLYYKTSGTERNVDLETIIPSLFRAYLENYKIVFKGLNKPIYKINTINENGNIELTDKYSLDLETKTNTPYTNVVLANNEQKAEFLRGILYRDFNTDEASFEKKFGVALEDYGYSLYDQLNGASKITEYLGVYYQNDDPNVPDIMKVEKRIITYVVEY